MKKKQTFPVVLSLGFIFCLGIGVSVYLGAREAFNPRTSSIPTASPDVPMILDPSELPADIQQRVIPWFSGALDLHTGKIVDTALNFASALERYQIYADLRERIWMRDLKTGEKKVLVSAEEPFPGAHIESSAIALSPDGRYVFFLVDWILNQAVDIDSGGGRVFRNYIIAVVRFDVSSEKIAILNVDPWFDGMLLSLSSSGEMVIQCSYIREGDLSSELCLLDSKGKFLRYLTFDGGYPGSIRAGFTPDGQWIVYTNHIKPGIYRVSAEGTRRRKISDCGTPVLITDDHVVAQCHLSLEPECYGLFLVNLDGSDFRRIGYVEPYCTQDKIP